MRSSRSVADPLDPGRQGFAHRGLHGPGVPENSLAAFRAALELGAGIECDVRLSADGEVMVFHDHDLRRLCGSFLEVEMTFGEILAAQRLLGSEETIPWLSELLDLVDGRVPILIELKTCLGNARKLAVAVANDIAAYAGPLGIMSFDAEVGHTLARNWPYVRRGLVISKKASIVERWRSILRASPNFLAVDYARIHRPWAARARRKRPLYTWTVRDAEQRRQAEVHADAAIWEGDGRP